VVNHSYYQTQIRVTPAGSVELSVLRINGSTSNQTTISSVVVARNLVKVGTPLSIQTQVTGTNPVRVQARAWVAFATQPAWQIDKTDTSSSRIVSAGGVGAWAYVSRTSTRQSVYFTNLDAFALSQTPAPATTPTGTPTATPTSTPTTPPTTTPSPTPTPTVPVTPQPNTGDAGAATIGSTNYAIPAGALFVSPSGSDSAAGTEQEPLRTIGRAIAVARSSNTIVLRGGTYHETVVVPQNKSLTIQSYPK
jgi:hypothetical protein